LTFSKNVNSRWVLAWSHLERGQDKKIKEDVCNCAVVGRLGSNIHDHVI
jgi:hypothetical protein